MAETEPTDELLTGLAEVSGRITELEADRDAKILAARTAGHSWAAIGNAMGTSKQAAWERHHRLTQEAS